VVLLLAACAGPSQSLAPFLVAGTPDVRGGPAPTGDAGQPALPPLSSVRPASLPAVTPLSMGAPATSGPLPSAQGWETYHDTEMGGLFELKAPDGWPVRSGGIDYAAIYHFGDLKLIVFSAAPVGSVDAPVQPFAETFERFRKSFVEDGIADTRKTGILTVEIIPYGTSRDNGIYTEMTGPGTVALWQKDQRGYALIDELNQHQSSGMFDQVLESFRFTGVRAARVEVDPPRWR